MDNHKGTKDTKKKNRNYWRDLIIVGTAIFTLITPFIGFLMKGESSSEFYLLYIVLIAIFIYVQWQYWRVRLREQADFYQNEIAEIERENDARYGYSWKLVEPVQEESSVDTQAIVDAINRKMEGQGS